MFLLDNNQNLSFFHGYKDNGSENQKKKKNKNQNPATKIDEQTNHKYDCVFAFGIKFCVRVTNL